MGALHTTTWFWRLDFLVLCIAVALPPDPARVGHARNDWNPASIHGSDLAWLSWLSECDADGDAFGPNSFRGRPVADLERLQSCERRRRKQGIRLAAGFQHRIQIALNPLPTPMIVDPAKSPVVCW